MIDWRRFLWLSSVALLACDDLQTATPEAEVDDDIALEEAPLAVPVRSDKELFITEPGVVRDAQLTRYAPGQWNTARPGAWSFGRLIDNLQPNDMPTDKQRSDFVMRWLRTWEQDQTVNGQLVPRRPPVRQVVIDPWKQRSIGKLPGNTAAACAPGPASDFNCKLSFAPDVVPFELMAVVNRPDLRVLPTFNDMRTGAAGQGRFVFVLVDAQRKPLPMTVIFEFMVPIGQLGDIRGYADRWHRLGARAFDQSYKDELQTITTTFARRNAAPWRQNGSALLQLRTNEVTFAPPGSDPSNPFGGALWEMREFILGSNGLTPDTVKQEPPITLSGSPILANWINANAAAVAAGTHSVPAQYQGQAFLAGSSFVPGDFEWEAPGVTEALRHSFALNTCNGCHRNETGTNFLQVFPTVPGDPRAQLSDFLKGELAQPNGGRVKDFTALLEQPAANVGPGPGRDPGRPPMPPQ